MDKIEIKGLEFFARHGVLPYEKLTPQTFKFDVTLSVDFFAAAATDDLTRTVDYGTVCDLVEKICKGNSYNLIEKLAYECAFGIMESFPQVQAATVSVSKPGAPVKQKFKDISVTAELKREKVILSLGSSIGDGENNINAALTSLNKIRGVKITKVSPFIKTPPYGGVAKNSFTNCAAEAECLISPRRLLDAIHTVEKEGGRVRNQRWEDRTIDVDIVFFGDRIIREEGLSVPHPDYQNRPFVIEPVKQIAPGFVCPLTGKRMSDL